MRRQSRRVAVQIIERPSTQDTELRPPACALPPPRKVVRVSTSEISACGCAYSRLLQYAPTRSASFDEIGVSLRRAGEIASSSCDVFRLIKFGIRIQLRARHARRINALTLRPADQSTWPPTNACRLTGSALGPSPPDLQTSSLIPISLKSWRRDSREDLSTCGDSGLRARAGSHRLGSYSGVPTTIAPSVHAPTNYRVD